MRGTDRSVDGGVAEIRTASGARVLRSRWAGTRLARPSSFAARRSGDQTSLRSRWAKPADGRVQRALFRAGNQDRAGVAHRRRFHELAALLKPSANDGKA